MKMTITRRRLMAISVVAPALMSILSAPSLAAAPDPAAQHIEQYYSTLLPTIKDTASLSVAERAQRIAPAITSAFDLPAMTRLAVGPHWSRFSGAQQEEVRDAFSKFVIANYAKQMQDYNGEAYKVDPVSVPRGNDRIVKTTIGSTVINYLVRGGRIIDIYFNGTVSDMATRRAEFSSIIASGGPEALIKNLRDRTTKLLSA
jgi:phospholipid transport system substrate-binding protein